MIPIIRIDATLGYTESSITGSFQMRRTGLAIVFFSLNAWAIGSASAQHSLESKQDHGARTPPLPIALSGPFQFAVHGAFRNMVEKQDYAGKVQLRDVMQTGATDALGAASGLRGEITVIDGKLLLTYGTPCPTCGHPGEDQAALLASAKVLAWQPPIPLSSDLGGRDLDEFIIAQAKTRGLDTDKPFPVRIKGSLVNVKMHVIRAANPAFKGHGSGTSMSDQENIAADSIEGEVVGFYAPEAAQGIISHPGEPFHFHWVDSERTRTAHLDAFTMAKGAILLLPKS